MAALVPRGKLNSMSKINSRVANGNMPIKLVILHSSGLTVQRVGSVNGVAVHSAMPTSSR